MKTYIMFSLRGQHKAAWLKTYLLLPKEAWLFVAIHGRAPSGGLRVRLPVEVGVWGWFCLFSKALLSCVSCPWLEDGPSNEVEVIILAVQVKHVPRFDVIFVG